MLTSGDLLVPVYGKGGKLATVQTINSRGDKFFVKGGEAHGGYHVLAPEQGGAQLASAVIRTATRQAKWGVADDPIAADILGMASAQEDLASLDRLVRDRGLAITGIAGAGASSLALDAGPMIVRVGTGELAPRAHVAEMLQAHEQGRLGSIRYEILPRVDTNGMTEAHVDQLVDALEAKGYAFPDRGVDNIGRLPNGNLVVLDPGSVQARANATTDDRRAVEAYQGTRPGAFIVCEGYATGRSILAAAPAEARSWWHLTPATSLTLQSSFERIFQIAQSLSRATTTISNQRSWTTRRAS